MSQAHITCVTIFNPCRMRAYRFVLEFVAFQFIEYFAHKALHRHKITRHLQHHKDQSLDSPFFSFWRFIWPFWGVMD